MINEDDSAVSDKDEEANDNQVSWMESRHTTVRGGKYFELLELLEGPFKSHKPSVDEPPILELKPLPTHLRDSGSRKKKRKKNWIHRTLAALWSKATAKSGRTGKQFVLKCCGKCYSKATAKSCRIGGAICVKMLQVCCSISLANTGGAICIKMLQVLLQHFSNKIRKNWRAICIKMLREILQQNCSKIGQNWGAICIKMLREMLQQCCSKVEQNWGSNLC
ncbi:hypothetical protein TIFTF001_036759 [Ficus carica]|uniref:Uncharacterized protein n=1 Tax=Ficus carica TaxID=3494 RepID=A0AA88E4X7_FICCA|nr:hypothetical protein TIFTF001_036759 [Ficus carica]